MGPHIKWTAVNHTNIRYQAQTASEPAILWLTDGYSGDGLGVEGSTEELLKLAWDIVAEVDPEPDREGDVADWLGQHAGEIGSTLSVQEAARAILGVLRA